MRPLLALGLLFAYGVSANARHKVPPPGGEAMQLYDKRARSPYRCSRAVARWVRDVLSHVMYEPAAKLKGFEFPAECPLSPANDIYSFQETIKSKRQSSGYRKCGVCQKAFKNEFRLDMHMEKRHPNLHNYGVRNGSEVSMLDPRFRRARAEHGVSLEAARAVKIPFGREEGEVMMTPRKEGAVSAPPAERPVREQNVYPPFGSFGSCLEDYCIVFDVCDRPATRRSPAMDSNLSVANSDDGEGAGDIYIRDGERCNPARLRQGHELCGELLEQCLPLGGAAEVRHLNRRLERDICGALESCERYLTRRKYTGSRAQFTRGAYMGTEFSPTNIPTKWIFAIVICAVSVAFAFSALIFRCLGNEESEVELQHARHHQEGRRELEGDGIDGRGMTFHDWAQTRVADRRGKAMPQEAYS